MAQEAKTELITYEPNAPIEDPRTFKGLISRPDILQSIAGVLPKHLDVNRLTKLALVAASRQPLLFQCTQASILGAVMKSAELGVSCSGTLARGFLVPYYNKHIRGYEAQFIIGYGGLIDIICEPGGSVSHVTAEVVYDQDQFRLELGTANRLDHIRDPRGARKDEDIIGAYMIAWIHGGGHFIQYLSRDEIEKHKARSSAKDKQGNVVGPWKTDYAAMCRKTPIRAGAQYLPLSKSQQGRIEETDEPIDYDAVPPVVTLTPTQGRQSWGFSEPQRQEPEQPEQSEDTKDNPEASSEQAPENPSEEPGEMSGAEKRKAEMKEFLEGEILGLVQKQYPELNTAAKVNRVWPVLQKHFGVKSLYNLTDEQKTELQDFVGNPELETELKKAKVIPA